MSALTPETIAALRKMEQAATPGPYSVKFYENEQSGCDEYLLVGPPPNRVVWARYSDATMYRDSSAHQRETRCARELMVAARNALPALLDAAEERDRLATVLRDVIATAHRKSNAGHSEAESRDWEWLAQWVGEGLGDVAPPPEPSDCNDRLKAATTQLAAIRRLAFEERTQHADSAAEGWAKLRALLGEEPVMQADIYAVFTGGSLVAVHLSRQEAQAEVDRRNAAALAACEQKEGQGHG